MMREAWRRWRAILRLTYAEYRDDQVSIVASGVAFRVAIAAFPGIALVLWIGVRLTGPGEAQAVLKSLTDALPSSSHAVVKQAIRSAMQNNPADNAAEAGVLGAAAPILGVLFTLWSTNSGMKALFTALNVIYDTEERRGFLRFTGVTLVFTIGLIILITLATMLIIAAPTVLAASGLSNGSLIGFRLLRWPVLFVGVAVALALLYRFAPNRPRESWRLVTFGSALASALVVVCSALFSWFVDRFASLAVTYGSLSSVIAFMLWLWVCFWLVLACAELDSCIEREPGHHGRDRHTIPRPQRGGASVRPTGQPSR